MSQDEVYSREIETSLGRVMVYMPDSGTAILQGYEGDIHTRHVVINHIPLRARAELALVKGKWQYQSGTGSLYRLDNLGEPTSNAWRKWREVCESEFNPTEEDSFKADYAAVKSKRVEYLKQIEKLQEDLKKTYECVTGADDQLVALRNKAAEKGITLE